MRSIRQTVQRAGAGAMSEWLVPGAAAFCVLFVGISSVVALMARAARESHHG